MYEVIMHKEKSACIAKAEFSLVFHWITGTIDFYVYENERQLKQALEDFHLYGDPTMVSGRVEWCSKPELLQRVRRNG